MDMSSPQVLTRRLKHNIQLIMASPGSPVLSSAESTMAVDQFQSNDAQEILDTMHDVLSRVNRLPTPKYQR